LVLAAILLIILIYQSFAFMLKNKKSPKEHHPETEGPNHPEVAEGGEMLDQSQGATATIKDEKADLQDKLRAEAADWNDKYVRLYAEFDNFKRRTLKERMELIQTANKDVVTSLLPVLDDFDRAIKSIETASDINSVKEGVALIQHKLRNILSQKGLKEMESKGQTFDADLHEGITNIPVSEEHLKGKIVDELEKGYFLNDKVIRFAKVVVGV